MHYIMVIDDEPAVLHALSRCLRAGFPPNTVQLELFSDPEAAILRAAETHFDVFISDYRMPGLNGADVMSLLKKIQPDGVRIILSASIDHGDILDTINRGQVFGFLSKPWNGRELVEVVQAALSSGAGATPAAPEVALSAQELEAKRLESEEPGITEVRRDEHGNIRLY